MLFIFYNCILHFTFIFEYINGSGISVGIAPDYELDGPGSNVCRR